MQHHLTLPEQQYKGLVENGKMYLVVKHKPTYSVEDTLSVTLEGHREQASYDIIAIDKEHVFGAYCILALKPLPVAHIEDAKQ